MAAETDIRECEIADRDASGRFQPGNPGGPGNPLGGRAAGIRRILMDCVSDDELIAIWKRVVAMAMDGHWQAIKLVLSYVAGKPAKMSELDAIDEPSPNGVFSAPDEAPAPPSPNGVFCEVPESIDAAPRADAQSPVAAPPPNGVFLPPRNRKERRAQRKAQRIARRTADGISP
jgi:hypothetical protein